VSYLSDLESEPWRFDFYNVLRRLERSHRDRPRIGHSAARREEYAVFGQDPFMDFPASTLSRVDRDALGRLRIYVKFLGLLGPQGALPLATTEEAYGWSLARDDAFPRFLDIINHRFIQLFFRAWADARPVAQFDRPEADRFQAYIGSAIGIGSEIYRNLDSAPDAGKMAYAGLIGAATKSASRLRSFISGLFGIEVDVEEFVGLYLPLDPADLTLIGQQGSRLGLDTLIGGSVFSLQDKFRLRLHVKSLAEYESFLPNGRRCRELADAVFFYIGDQLDWDLELAIPAGAVPPMRLGRSGRLGWTSWMSPQWEAAEGSERTDARFQPARRSERAGAPG
jgi:type VI secretion system protein ImpH